MVSALDEAIGNITDQLRESGLYDDTLIVFTADVSFVETKNNTCIFPGPSMMICTYRRP